jgi:beta-galactosidase/beta-glucuronidase
MKPIYLFICLVSIQSTFADWKPVPGKMLTPWASKLDPKNVWAEYPRPQLQRQNWTNLNGIWEYGIGENRGTGNAEGGVVDSLKGIQWGEILVPFCPESSLSGVGKLIEPNQALWYRRGLSVQPVAGERTLLHFEAVDYEATFWVNDTEVGKHIGGNTPFTFDITSALTDAESKLTMRVYDATEDGSCEVSKLSSQKGSLTPGSVESGSRCG